ncbi:MAG TPA: hypothetical protein VEA40_12525 [Ramlibacter sp.]|nr:hypothetical protein [Ramlibacter sp.]
MRIILRKVDGVVVYAGDDLELSADGATGSQPSPWVDRGTTSENADLKVGVTLPSDWKGGHFVFEAGVFVPTADHAAAQAQQLGEHRATFIARVDAEVDAIIGSVVGNRVTEYAEALKQALEFKAAGYTGPVPDYVASWTAAKAASGWTDKQAADDIITTGTKWKAAERQLREKRLLLKEVARLATTPAALATAVAQWDGFTAAIKAALKGA